MKLNLHTDYALRTLIYLTVHRPKPATIQEMADAYGVSSHHLAKVVQALVRHGYVESLRGRGGGLRLAREPQDIRLGTVLREMEKSLALVECLGDDPQCPIDGVCGLKHVLAKARHAFLDVIDQYSVQDLVQRPSAYIPLLAHGKSIP